MELYSHQREAIEKLGSGSILCGGVGSGKTIASLAFFFNKILGGDCEKGILPKKAVDLYIITTAQKRDTMEWEEDMAKVPLRIGENEFGDVKLYCHIDSWNNINKYINVEKAFFIFDEQRVVGYGAWVKSFLEIAKHNAWILLSATPGDRWIDYVPVFIANGFFKNKSEFVRNHVIYSRYTKFPKIERYIDTGVLNFYRRKILVPMADQRTTHRNKFIEVVEYDKDKYTEIMVDRKNPETGKPIKNAGELCLILRKLVNSHPSRLEKIKSIVQRHKRVIIFYNFVFECDMLREWCIRNYIPFAELNGQKHQPLPDTDWWVYLVQYSAGCEGWNCVETNAIIFYSNSYSYKQMEQASGRIDRINTPYSELYYYYLQSRSPLDLSIRKCLDKKEDFNASAFAT